MKHTSVLLSLTIAFGLGAALARFSGGSPFNLAATAQAPPLGAFDRVITQNTQRMIEEGRRIFRFDTFGDEAFWGDTLQLHRAIEGGGVGGVGPGVGPGVSPKTALAVGLKVDMDALPPALVDQVKAGKVDLHARAPQNQRGRRGHGVLQCRRQPSVDGRAVRPLSFHGR